MIDALLPGAATVVRSIRETGDVFTLQVQPDSGPVSFAPGQFSMVSAWGVGEVPISISGDPQDGRTLNYTIRGVGKVSQALIHLNAGDKVGLRGPFGRAWPIEQARGGDVLLVAGGIGLAPLRPVISTIAAHRTEYGRLILLYGARSPGDLLYRRQFQKWNRLPEAQVLHTVDYGGANWHGYTGVVTKLFPFAQLRPERTTAMICGPEVMMRFVLRELEARKFPPNHVFLSMERNMKCAVGSCGHCQMGPYFVCKDGPVFPYTTLRPWMEVLREL